MIHLDHTIILGPAATTKGKAMLRLAVAWVMGFFLRFENAYPNHTPLGWGMENHKQNLETKSGD